MTDQHDEVTEQILGVLRTEGSLETASILLRLPGISEAVAEEALDELKRKGVLKKVPDYLHPVQRISQQAWCLIEQ